MERQPQESSRPDVTLEPARLADAEALTEISRRTFDDDALAYRGAAGGPPGYDSVAWQRQQIRRGGYFKVLAARRLVGGAIVTQMGPRRFDLGRLFVDTSAQNRGIGRRAMELLHAAIPADVWTLDTPDWAVRNRRFYESLGYRRVGTVPYEGFDLILYERR